MKELDITFDLETCSLASNAAVMQIAAVAWVRTHEVSESLFNEDDSFNTGVDLRSCVMDGLDFDPKTIAWWTSQNKQSKDAVLSCDPVSIREAVFTFLMWINERKEAYGAEKVYLWAEGSDFDVAVLKTLCKLYGFDIPVVYTSFRDARTFVLESGQRLLQGHAVGATDGNILHERECYAAVTKGFKLPDVLSIENPHDALYDCYRTAWNTWCALHQVEPSETSLSA